MSDISTKRKKITQYIIKHISNIDPSKTNSKRYTDFFNRMTDEEFDQYMHYLKEGKVQIYVVAPNMKINLEMNNLLEVANNIDLKLFERIWMTDSSTGKRFLTPHEYMILNIYTRRVRQYLEHKISLPENDNNIDGLTGQVIKPSQASSMSQVEMQALAARNFDNSILELMKVRGGDIHAYDNFKRQCEEMGTANLSELEENTVPRSAVMMGVFLKAMHLDNNLVEIPGYEYD